MGGGGNPPGPPRFEFPWTPTEFEFQVLYQIFLARQEMLDQWRKKSLQISQLKQTAGLQKDQIEVLLQVAQSHHHAVEFLFDSFGKFSTEVAGLAQNLQPLQVFAKQVEGALQHFYAESTKTAAAAAQTAQKVAEHQSLITGLQAAAGQKDSAIEQRFLRLEAELDRERIDKRQLQQQMAKMVAESEEKRKSTATAAAAPQGAAIFENLQQQVLDLADVVQQCTDAVSSANAKIAALQQSAQGNQVQGGNAQQEIEFLKGEIAGIGQVIGKFPPSVEQLQNRIFVLEQGMESTLSADQNIASIQLAVSQCIQRIQTLEDRAPIAVGAAVAQATRGPGFTTLTTAAPSCVQPIDNAQPAQKNSTAAEPILPKPAQQAGGAAGTFSADYLEKLARLRSSRRAGSTSPSLPAAFHENDDVASDLPSRPPYATSTATARSAKGIRLELEGTASGAAPAWFGVGGSTGSVAGYAPSGHGAQRPAGAGGEGPGQTAQVNALGVGPSPAGCVLYPGYALGYDFWKSITKPKFSGQPIDYARFEADWDWAESQFRNLHGSMVPVNDFHLLQEF